MRLWGFILPFFDFYVHFLHFVNESSVVLMQRMVKLESEILSAMEEFKGMISNQWCLMIWIECLKE